MWFRFLVNFILISATVFIIDCAPLESRLHHYDTLHHRDLFSTTRVRRSAERHITEKVIEFKTLGRDFKLHLHPQRGIFSKKFEVTALAANNTRRHVDIDPSDFLEGYIDGFQYDSKVFAYYERENLVATITTPKDIYHVEPSWRHLPDKDEYTMISYRASDVKKDTEKHPEHHMGKSFCGYVHADTGVDDAAFKEPPPSPPKKEHSRNKRQTSAHNTCPLMLVADYHFFQGVGGSDVAATARYLVGVVSRVNDIYTNSDFGDGYTGMGFEVQNILIHESPTAVSSGSTHYNMAATSWKTQDLLTAFSYDSTWKDYCLAHLFTYLAFSDGVLGLGWIAESSKNSAGGICSPNSGGYYYNTAWTSALNKNGDRLLTQEADLVTSHEFGHNWGSPHDPDTTECAPSSNSGGSYLMYTYSVSGYDTNNKMFSPCSKRIVNTVLASKAASCFTEKSTSYCGNYIVEDQEECDAGPNSRAGTDPCCDSNCQFKTGSVCSDANSLCCSGCQIASAGIVCRTSSDTTCEGDGNCDGSSTDCPASTDKADGTSCIDNGLCKSGVCQTLCQSAGMVSCLCDQLDQACKYCCRNSTTGPCLPYDLYGLGSGASQELPDGRTCIQGVCQTGVCEKVIRSTTDRLWSIIKDFSIDKLLKFMKDNLVIVSVILSLIIYVPFCLIIFCVDRCRDDDDKEAVAWHDGNNDSLVRDGERRRIRSTYSRNRPIRSETENVSLASASAVKVKTKSKPRRK